MTWITDRTRADIERVLLGFRDEETLERATITPLTLERWRENILEILELDNNIVSLDVPSLSSDSNARIRCTYPGKPIYAGGDDSVEIQTDVSFNPVYPYIEWFNEFIKAVGLDVSSYTIPKTTEYLTYDMLNDLESACQESYTVYKENLSRVFSGTIFCGEDFT